MLTLDGDGLLPPGPHAGSEAEVRSVFTGIPDTAIRAVRIEQWIRHRSAVRDVASIREQWVDGGFVTTKPDPEDVDVITVVEGLVFDALPEHKQDLMRFLHRGHQTRDDWGVDAFLLVRYPDGHPDYTTWSAGQAYWTWEWARVRGRTDRWKGWVVVS